MIGFLEQRMRESSTLEAIAHDGRVYTYADVVQRMVAWQTLLAQLGIGPGRVVSVEGDYTIETVSAFLALTANLDIAVPLSRDSQAHAAEFLELGEVEYRLIPDSDCRLSATGRLAGHTLYGKLRERRAPGLVLFTSGSTGKNKAAVHDLAILLKKFQVQRHCYRTLVFLQLDHIGGVNTLFYTLSNSGTVIVAPDRSPDAVGTAIETYKVELLPTSPTFLNLLLLSGAYERHDLASLKLITYGTETMPESTLRNVAEAFPAAKLQQTYGLTELGILRSKSRGQDSLWVRVGGEGYETKVVDGRLWVRAESAMLGYLNAPSPFDEDGYFDTGDRVEVDGEWLRILGRDSEIINVGGNKVYPAEVESVLLQLDNVVDVAVYGERHPLTGHMVVASVLLGREEPPQDFKVRMRQFCRERLAGFKIPSKVVFAEGPLYSSRFKRMRRAAAQSAAAPAHDGGAGHGSEFGPAARDGAEPCETP
jgi:long-chain acyl-CoA synthetase